MKNKLAVKRMKNVINGCHWYNDCPFSNYSFEHLGRLYISAIPKF